jgi:hypothetical protein
MQKRANLARRRRGAMAFLVACLMTSTLTEPSLGVGFGRGCEGAIVDGAGREGVAAVYSAAENIYMDFRDAINELCAKIDHDDVAKALGVSVQTIRQARMSVAAKAHREPPREWQDALIRLAEERVWHYRKLIEEIRGERSPKPGRARDRGRNDATASPSGRRNPAAHAIAAETTRRQAPAVAKTRPRTRSPPE